MTANLQRPKVVRTRGEPYVWICSMGLAIGLLMVIALLWLILSQGISVFWPAKIAKITLKTDPKATPGDMPVLAGRIVKEQRRTGHGSGDIPADATEWQLFVGNRDTYGYSFKYVNSVDVASVEYLPEMLVIERMQNGDAIGTAMGLDLADGTKIGAQDASFEPRLKALVRAASQRRTEIEKIEKREIGELSGRLKRLKTRGAAETETAVLEAQYEVLAAKALQLREQQSKDTFRYQLAGGEDHTLAVGEIVGLYRPNKLGFFGKVGQFGHHFWTFLSDNPREANTEGGIFPAIFGTFVMTLLMSMAVMPFGIIAAIYLREYAKQGLMVQLVRIAVNNLAGVPSIVFGVFGLGFFVYFIGGAIDEVFFKDTLPTPTFGTGGILWASLTLALMTVPVIIVATEEALAAVPRGAREASLACGASKWQTIQRVVLPASASGILTGLILAMARGAGEVAPLMLVGVVKLAPSLPLDGSFPFFHLDRKFMHLGFHIYDLGFQSPDSEAAKPMVFATTLFLILLVVLLNLAAILIRERLRRKYATGAF